MSHKANRTTIDRFLHTFLERALPAAPTEADLEMPFLELGANSLVLMEVQRAVESRFGLRVAIPQFFQELTHTRALAEYIERNQIADAHAASAEMSAGLDASAPGGAVQNGGQVALIAQPLPGGSAALSGGALEELLVRQLESASRAIQQVVAQQLQALTGMPIAAPAAVAQPEPTSSSGALSAVAPSAPVTSVRAAADDAGQAAAPSSAVVSHRMLSPLEIRARGLTEPQSRHLEALIHRFTDRTRRSKELAARDRAALADSRAAVGFRFTTKEMLYPIVGRRAKGARIWDVDGNEYVDITMGQGVTLFGHHPDFIEAALADPENDLLLLGPRPPQVGEAARLVCELTGMERATFTNTGTEAIMAAMRLARAATGRSRIVMFENAYHGHADGVMGRAVRDPSGALHSVPVAPGIPQGAVDDLWLLDYGSDEALEFIRAHGHEIAAVVVEPVQSRRPDLQPRAFLQELRRITQDSGALLVFDEMITGFRIHPGGAQAWFDVRADIATYGKVVAGGMPIGVVAGAARYMDAIDGGMWQYGDASYPAVDRTIFGGTFCQHPTAMITALATLRHLKAQGPALQEALNRRTDGLAARLNDFFDIEDVPIRVVHFGSLFRFAFSANFELLFYHLMEKGIFIWEWRNYFLSTAHDDADVDRIVDAVRESVAEMRSGGFLPQRGAGVTAVAAVPAPVPLSAAQRQLAVLAQIQPEGSLAYHVNALLRLHGDLEQAALRTALRDLVRRHEALRTVIDGERQRVLPWSAVSGADGFTLTDLRDSADPQAALEQVLAERTAVPFDLAKGPLFEAHLVLIAPNDARLLLKAHHAVVDGLSMNLIVQELAALYTSALRGTPLELAPTLQARDHASWRAGADLSAQRDHWLEALSGELSSLELPADRSAPAMRSFRGARHRVDVSPALFARIRAMARAQGCTHFMALFAAYALWLHRICQQDDLRVGMPVAGRGFEGGDRLVGYCTHLLPVRSRIRWDESFAEYLRRTRDVLLGAYENQDFPFAELIELPELRGRRAQIVETVFNLDRPGVAPAMAGLEVTWQSQPIRYTPFDLTLNLTELGDALVLECDYSLDRFDPETIARHVDGLLALLETIADKPDEKVSRLPVVAPADLRRMLVDWNATGDGLTGETCAHRLFEAQAAQTPDAPAVIADDTRWSYRELDAAANRIAHWLRAQGVARGAVVGICGHRTPWLPAALLGVMKAGAAYLPLDPSNPPQRLRFMFEDSGAVALLADTDLAERLAPPEGLPLLRLDAAAEVLAGLPETRLETLTGPDDLAYLIYTSGSTGQPKGALIEHRGLGNYLRWAVARYEQHLGDGVPLHASISFDGTVTSVFCPLIAGRAITLLPEGGAEIDHIRQALASGREWSLLKVTPAHLELLNATLSPDELAGRTRFVVLGGEALLGRQVAPWRRGAPATRLINEYGPTETVVGCCVHEVTDRDAEGDAVPIGRPIANTRLYVLDANLQPVPQGARGELFIGGDGVARGYHRRPELTAERFIEVAATGLADIEDIPAGRLYRTGDLVRWLPDASLVYLGRLDSQVKLRGFRVELGEIESALLRQPGVREAAVAVDRRSDTDLRVVAWVGRADGANPDEAGLRSALAESLPVHMLPWRILVMDRLPINGSGKIDRVALVRPATSRAAPQEAVDETERQVSRIWCELLEVERVGRDENFFEVGGHSLLVLPLRDRLAALAGRPVEPGDVFRHPTVAAQARFVAGASVADGDEAAQRARDAGARRRDVFRQMRDRGRARG